MICNFWIILRYGTNCWTFMLLWPSTPHEDKKWPPLVIVKILFNLRVAKYLHLVCYFWLNRWHTTPHEHHERKILPPAVILKILFYWWPNGYMWYPSKRKTLRNVGFMLGERRWRCVNIKPTLAQRIMFAGMSSVNDLTVQNSVSNQAHNIIYIISRHIWKWKASAGLLDWPSWCQVFDKKNMLYTATLMLIVTFQPSADVIKS